MESSEAELRGIIKDLRAENERLRNLNDLCLTYILTTDDLVTEDKDFLQPVAPEANSGRTTRESSPEEVHRVKVSSKSKSTLLKHLQDEEEQNFLRLFMKSDHITIFYSTNLKRSGFIRLNKQPLKEFKDLIKQKFVEASAKSHNYIRILYKPSTDSLYNTYRTHLSSGRNRLENN
jgi:hypothetical protein